jgi:hypothetical protein
MKIEWRSVLRDALGVLLIGSLGGWAGGALSDEPNGAVPSASAVVLMTVGFCVSGCLAKQARFKHLALVAMGVWLIGTILKLISPDGSLVQLLAALPQIFLAMLLGGLVSLAIVRPPPAAEPPAPAEPPPAAEPPA